MKSDRNWAAADLNRAIELNPEDPTAHRELYWLYLEGQDFERALGQINAVIEQNLGDYVSYYQRGVILREMGDMRAAMQNFKQYVDKVPFDVCPDCFEDAQQFLVEVPEPTDRERPLREGEPPGLGIEIVPLDELAPEIPWLPIDLDLRPTTFLVVSNLEQEPYHNLFLRRALALALDREHLARVAQDTGFVHPRGATTFTHSDNTLREAFHSEAAFNLGGFSRGDYDEIVQEARGWRETPWRASIYISGRSRSLTKRKQRSFLCCTFIKGNNGLDIIFTGA